MQAAVILIPGYDGRNSAHHLLVHALIVVRLMRVLRLPTPSSGQGLAPLPNRKLQ